jgi:hypothetical protein
MMGSTYWRRAGQVVDVLEAGARVVRRYGKQVLVFSRLGHPNMMLRALRDCAP